MTIFSSEVKKATLRILKHPSREVISMKKTIIIGLSLVLGLALIATVALAWGPGFGPGFGRGFGGQAYGSPPIPSLTPEQSSKIQTLRETSLKEIEPLQKDLWTKRTELRNLPENQRMALVLKRYDDLSYQEIAQIIGCSVSAVESLLVRAKRSLKEKLKIS